jgi:hypothetical protein
MESIIIIIIDQNLLLGVCLGPGLRPWRGGESVSNHCYPDATTWCRQSGGKQRFESFKEVL